MNRSDFKYINSCLVSFSKGIRHTFKVNGESANYISGKYMLTGDIYVHIFKDYITVTTFEKGTEVVRVDEEDRKFLRCLKEV
jgi:hypothetical protein